MKDLAQGLAKLLSYVYHFFLNDFSLLLNIN